MDEKTSGIAIMPILSASPVSCPGQHRSVMGPSYERPIEPLDEQGCPYDAMTGIVPEMSPTDRPGAYQLWPRPSHICLYCPDSPQKANDQPQDPPKVRFESSSKDQHWRRRKKSCRAATSSAVCFAISLVAVLASCLLGVLFFRSLQVPNEKTRTLSISTLRNRTVLKLWNITDQFNVLYKENWTSLVTKEMILFQQQLFEIIRQEGHDGYDGHPLSESSKRVDCKNGKTTQAACFTEE